MANSIFLPLPVLGLFLLHLLFYPGGIKPANGQAPGQGAWCIPKPSTSDQALMENINYACNSVDCSAIQENGACFHPTTLMNHASVVMNLYYQKQGRHFWNCDFKDTGVVVVTNPSYGYCKFEHAQ